MIPRVSHISASGAVIAWACVASASAQLVFDGALLDANGRLERAGISALRLLQGEGGAGGGGGGEMTVIDSRGSARSRPVGEALALVPRSWADPQSPGAAAPDPWAMTGSPYIELVDGQRFVGRPGRIGAEGETVAWVHERFGTLSLPIDEIARFVMRPGAPAAASAPDAPGGVKSDTLWLVNGDRLEGFLETIGPRAGGEGFALTIESGGNRVTVPVDQVVRAQFANPARPAKGAVAWLADGSIVALAAVATDTAHNSLLLTPSLVSARAAAAAESPGAATTAQFTSAEVSAIAFDSARVAPLAQAPILSHTPIGLPRRPGPRVDAFEMLPTPLGAADVLIPGPMEVEWALPAGANRLIGSARLDEADWMWGECTVVVEVVPASGQARELVRFDLGASSIATPLNAELGGSKPGDRLRVRIEPGELGPIRDRVRLERVMLLR